jgi:transcriptional regulator with XRE-family HTH domain
VITNKFGETVRKLRQESHLRQREVASKIGIDVPMLSKIESGDRRAKRETVALLSDVLGADPEELIALWLADHMIGLVQDAQLTLRAIEIAGAVVKINSSKR